MSSNDGGPAFPALTMLCGSDTVVASCHNSAQPGMSLRDWFAGQALAGLLADTNIHAGANPEGYEPWPSDTDEFRASVASAAYRYGDAMIAARKAEGGEA